MTLSTVSSNATATSCDINQVVNHLQGAAGNTEAYHLRVSSSNDFIITLSDACGAQKFSIQDSAGSEVFAVDSDGALTFTGSLTTIGDDAAFAWGCDNDVVIYHRSTSLPSDSALSAVFVGTPNVAAIPANSGIVSNVTADGDIVFAANKCGNSEEYLRLDASGNRS